MPDHILIGSGINALVAGAMLALKGDKVLILEREDRIGGCMATEEVTLPGFHHDVMAATFCLFTTSPAYAALGKHLAKHGLEFCHTHHPTATLRPDGSALVLTTDRATNIANFNALMAGEGDHHAADVGKIEQEASFLFALLAGPLWSLATLIHLVRRALKIGPRNLAAWFGQALAPARGWLESYNHPLTQALWAPWVLHSGLTPDSTGSALMGKVVAFTLETAGAPVAKGGAGQVAQAFVRLIVNNGGEVRTGVDVDRIRVQDGKVRGVITATGERIAAGSVLASVAPGQLMDRLLRETDLIADKAAAKTYRHGRGNFQVHYALSEQPDWHTLGLNEVALIHLADGIDSVSKSANQAERGLLPSTPTICVGQPHRLDPSRCPDGKAILWLQVPDAPRRIKGDAANEIATTPDWTKAVREAFADRIEVILASHIKGFDKIILKRRAYSPADLEAININLVGGDPYGGATTPDQFYLWRPFAHSTNGTTKLKGFHHIGASTHPGPGLSGMSGYLAAKRLGA